MHLQVIILASSFCLSTWAYCPPCGQTLLAQVKLAPWANVPPPAPNAPTTACGCGVKRVTPRDEIQKMSSADQRAEIGQLSKETAALQEQVDEMKEKNGEALDKLEAKFKKAQEAEEKQRNGIEEDAKKRNGEREEAKNQIDDDQDEMETVSKDIAEHKATLKELQSELSTLLMVMETCPCKDKKFLLAQTTKFASLLAAHATGQGSEKEPLYFKIEELEEKRNTLQEELTDEIGSFGLKQRRLLQQIDMVEAKMNRQSSKADMYEHTDQNMAKGVKRQEKAMADYLAHKKSQLERVDKDVQAAQKKYDDLEKAMKKCGCGPSF